MALKNITLDGVHWSVWDVRPALSGRPHSPIATAAGFEDGWLCFDSGAEKRRTAPLPAGWEDWADSRLMECLAAAAPVSRPRPAGTIPNAR